RAPRIRLLGEEAFHNTPVSAGPSGSRFSAGRSTTRCAPPTCRRPRLRAPRPRPAPPAQPPASPGPVIDGSATPAVTAARLLGGASRLIRNGAVTAVLTCPAAASRSCRGTVRILARLPGQRTNRGGPRRERVVGSRAYSIRLGRRARIRIPLGR